MRKTLTTALKQTGIWHKLPATLSINVQRESVPGRLSGDGRRDGETPPLLSQQRHATSGPLPAPNPPRNRNQRRPPACIGERRYMLRKGRMLAWKTVAYRPGGTDMYPLKGVAFPTGARTDPDILTSQRLGDQSGSVDDAEAINRQEETSSATESDIRQEHLLDTRNQHESSAAVAIQNDSRYEAPAVRNATCAEEAPSSMKTPPAVTEPTSVHESPARTSFPPVTRTRSVEEVLSVIQTNNRQSAPLTTLPVVTGAQNQPLMTPPVDKMKGGHPEFSQSSLSQASSFPLGPLAALLKASRRAVSPPVKRTPSWLRVLRAAMVRAAKQSIAQPPSTTDSPPPIMSDMTARPLPRSEPVRTPSTIKPSTRVPRQSNQPDYLRRRCCRPAPTFYAVRVLLASRERLGRSNS